MRPLLLALPVAALFTVQAPPPATEVPTRLTLDVVAVGRNGAPVADLKPSEFEVWISGYRVPVDEVAFRTPDTAARTIVLLLDNAAVGPDLAPRVQEAARAVVKRLGQRDRIIVVPVHGSSVDSTGEPARVLQAIDSYRVQGLPLRVEDAGQHVLTLIGGLARQLTEIPGRKVIVAIGAVWLFDTPLPPPGLRDLHDFWLAAMRSTAAAHVSLYVIDPVGLRPFGGFATYGGEAGFAAETGGYAFTNTNALAEAAGRVVDEAGTYYELRMADPPVQRTADLRKVEVKALRNDVTIRTRRGIPGRR